MSPFIDRSGFTEQVTTLSPRTRESNIACPVFLFHARDDETVNVSQTTALADRLKTLGKPVTLDLTEEGGHYQPMLDIGIPHAIEWLKKHAMPMWSNIHEIENVFSRKLKRFYI